MLLFSFIGYYTEPSKTGTLGYDLIYQIFNYAYVKIECVLVVYIQFYYA